MKLSGAIAAICLASATAFAPAPVSRVSFPVIERIVVEAKERDIVGDVSAWNRGIKRLRPQQQPLVVSAHQPLDLGYN